MALKKRDISYTNSVAALKNRVAVPDYFFDALPKDLHALAFYVSEIEKVSEVQNVLDSLQNAVDKGVSFQEWKSQINVKSLSEASESKIMAVYRNNTNSVYNNSARFNSLSSRVTPYLVVSVVGDDRTRPTHLEMDGVCARADSKIWDTHLPPFEHNCRCRVRAVTAEEAKRLGITHSVSGLPKFEFSKRSTSYGNVLGGVQAKASQVNTALKDEPELKKKFDSNLSSIQALAQILFERNAKKFLRGF